METLQKYRPLSQSVRRNKERSTGAKRKIKERTDLPATNGFLKSRFVPMVMGKASLKDWKQTQQDFFSSYHHFVDAKGITPIDYAKQVFPFNIALAYRQVKDYMEQNYFLKEILITENSNSSCCITTVEAYDTNMTLYYVPLRPLFRLQKDKSKRLACDLLLSVCAYLMNVAHIPSYHRGDYIATCYEMIKESTASEPEDWFSKAEYNSALSEFKEADYFGKRLGRQLANTCHLQQWQKRLDMFKINDGWDATVFMVSEKAHRLYLDYPNQKFYENINPELFFAKEDERTRADEYISFTWSESGWLFDELFEMVNSDLQENGIVDEPLQLKTFDKPGGSNYNNLDFEKRLFELLSNLSEILYNLSDE
ncbi:MAG: hypothetical protein P0Y49_14185 [Candidatus Pedobacter colombiensis]|uniref:Uncharacterized protein n=1 Tax=Candidatus Pedobacter colombiensis TaxID=3121371 RepID=A0AAJ5W4Q8_9SPHI|nr:hypothetical protein [Pedobacter sp.]WEK17947.1 MAG: hypothetical protein P0Y49_14185 [Pedobacter sp.]